MKQETKTNWVVVLFIFQIILIIFFLICYKVIDKKNALTYRKADIAGVIGGFTAMHDTQYEDHDYIEEYRCKDCGEWIIIDKKTLTLSTSDKAFKGCSKRWPEILEKLYDHHSLRRTRDENDKVVYVCADCGLKVEEIEYNKGYKFDRPFEDILKCKGTKKTSLSESDKVFEDYKKKPEMLKGAYNTHHLHQTKDENGKVVYTCPDCGLRVEEVAYDNAYIIYGDLNKCKE